MNLSLNTFRISLAREIKRGRSVGALYLKFENFEFKSRSNPASATVVVPDSTPQMCLYTAHCMPASSWDF